MFKFMAAALVAGGMVVAAMPVVAEEKCSFSYEAFEFSVPHIDLDECPAALNAKEAFCRAGIAGDQLHVFVFSEKGDRCLIAMNSYDEESFSITIK